MKAKEKILLLLMGGFFLLFFSYMTSPIFPYSYGWDSSFFQIVGGGMTKGMLPYRDFFDMKGPWLFFFEYFGQLLSYGRVGCFIVQIICMAVTLLLCHKIYSKYYSGNGMIQNAIMTLPLFLIMSVTIEGGNLTEELSLPFLIISLYFSLEYIKGEAKEHKPKYAIVYGVCFGILALLRITNAVLICAIILTVMINLLLLKQWKNFKYNLLAIFLGIGLSFLPPILYYGYHGEVKEMLFCTFIFGFNYGTEGFAFGTGMQYLPLLLVPIVVLTVIKNSNKRLWLLVFSNAAGMIITLGMGNSTLHDYLLVIPGVMIGVWELMKAIKKREISMLMLRGKILAIILIILSLYPGAKALKTTVNIWEQARDTTTYNHVIEIAGQIPEKDKDSVLGYEVPMRWYAISDIMPSNRYCGWQEHYMKLSPQITAEMEKMFETSPPQWIVTKSSAATIESKLVLYQLENQYVIEKENADLKLYKRL